MQDTKKELRERMLKQRKNMTAEEAKARSQAAQKRLMDSEPWAGAGCVLLYASYRNEIQTVMLLEDAWRRGLTVLLPRCCRLPGAKADDGLTGELEMARVTAPAQLASGAYGIAEPDPEYCPPEQDCHIDLVLLPGVAYDRQGGRLGYGGGYYDRLIDSGRLDEALLVGFAYSWQLLQSIPKDHWDKPVHAVCTDEEWLWI